MNREDLKNTLTNLYKLKDDVIEDKYQHINYLCGDDDLLGIINNLKKEYVELKISFDGKILTCTFMNEVEPSINALIILRYYFDKYDNDNLIFTANKANIDNFFAYGITKLVQNTCRFEFKIDNTDECYEYFLKIYFYYSGKDKIKKLQNEFVKKQFFSHINNLNDENLFNLFNKILEEKYNLEQKQFVENLLNTDEKQIKNPYLKMNLDEFFVSDSLSALKICLNELAKVDLLFISAITGFTIKKIREDLKGLIYQNPLNWNENIYDGFELASEYLSGNITEKINVVKTANASFNDYFIDNLKALEALLIKDLKFKDIHITFGTSFIPTTYIDEFIYKLFGTSKQEYSSYYNDYEVKYDLGKWKIPYKNRYFNDVKVNKEYGTEDLNALEIIENMLNQKPNLVYDYGKKTINREATLVAFQKEEILRNEFYKFLSSDEDKVNYLTNYYIENFASYIKRNFDGSYLTLKNMNKKVELYDYQKNAISRILTTNNTLLAHDVGAGKTYVMIIAGMELRRIKLAKKILYVVPNNIVAQWKELFLYLYKDANVLTVDPKTYEKKNREVILKNMRDDDYDACIIAYSCFNDIKMKYHQNNKNTIFFEDLDFDCMFVDECHNFKNVSIATSIKNVLGINTVGSTKCNEMMDKVIYMNNRNKKVVFATGTPITNSITDIYIMQRYLMPDIMLKTDIFNFNDWVSMFATKKEDFEIDIVTTGFRIATRFSEFHNLPELSNLFCTISDFHRVRDNNKLPLLNEYDDVEIDRTDLLKHYLLELADRAYLVRTKKVKRFEDNMLKICTDGRKAALDLRLVYDEDSDEYKKIDLINSKVHKCADVIYENYISHKDENITQAVFLDISTPKDDFNIYDELKKILIEKGFDKNEVAYIHDASTEEQKTILLEKVNNGEIKVIIGSTMKLGTGVNIQKRLYAVHHLDVPWRPSDMIQREGRILRQGNLNTEVKIYRYFTNGSFDAYNWQILETKQKFISQILSGTIGVRECDDIDELVLNYGEIKALAIGNNLLKKRVEVYNSLIKYKMLQRNNVIEKKRANEELPNLKITIDKQISVIENLKKDKIIYEENLAKYDNISKEQKDIIKKELIDAIANQLAVDTEVDKKVYEYMGFDVYIPSNLKIDNPIIYFSKYNKHYVELGDKKTGYSIRIDNKLKKMDKDISEAEFNLNQYKKNYEDLEKIANDNFDYNETIEKLTITLEEIDKELNEQ